MDSIVKKIHYCWFGGGHLGKNEIHCIESWKKFLPDFEIVQWNETNFNVHSCEYTAEAYKAKKWAFVSDYARFSILYKFGGLYFDTDVELINSLDGILANGPFMGIETDCVEVTNSVLASGTLPTVNSGLGLFAIPAMDIYKQILASYQVDHFFNKDGSNNETTVVTRVTEILRKYGLVEKPGIQEVAGLMIYPAEFFNPKNFYTGKIVITENTKSIHHFNMSWLDQKRQFEVFATRWFKNRGVNGRLPYKLAAGISVIRFLDFARFKRILAKMIGN